MKTFQTSVVHLFGPLFEKLHAYKFAKNKTKNTQASFNSETEKTTKNSRDKTKITNLLHITRSMI